MSEYFTILDEAEFVDWSEPEETRHKMFVRYQTSDGRVDSMVLPKALTKEAKDRAITEHIQRSERLRIVDYVGIIIISSLTSLFADFAMFGFLNPHFDSPIPLESAWPLLVFFILLRSISADFAYSMVARIESTETYRFRIRNLALAALVYGVPLLAFWMFYVSYTIPSLYWGFHNWMVTTFGQGFARNYPLMLLMSDFPRGIVFVVLRRRLRRRDSNRKKKLEEKQVYGVAAAVLTPTVVWQRFSSPKLSH